MGITNLEKIDLLNARIFNLDTHINILTEDITSNPESDIQGKPTRQSILEEFQARKLSLVLVKEALTNQG